MANLTRVTGKIFGETASTTNIPIEIGQFGSAKLGTYNATGDVEAIQNLAAWSNGWVDAVTPTQQFPSLPEMTGVHKVLSYQTAYTLQKGVPEWDAGTTYYTGDFCKGVGEGKLYVSKIDSNINNDLTDTNSWEEFASGGATRNIGEIVASTIPLTDAGLHLLDGARLSGDGIYGEFVDYIGDLYNNTKVYNPSAFTVVGSPTITDDGIASGFGSGNYINIQPFSATSNTNFEIITSFKVSNFPSSGSKSIFRVATNDYMGSFGFSLKIDNLSAVGLSGVWATDTYYSSLSTNVFYTVKIKVNNGIASLYLNDILLNSGAYTKNIESAYLTLGAGSETDYIDGSIDLKQFSIAVDGVEVFKGTKTDWSCLEAEWQASITNYGVCGKFVYNSTNNTVRLPKYSNKIYTNMSTAPVVGNGMTLGVTYGNNVNFGLATTASYGIHYDTNSYGEPVGKTPSTGALEYKSFGVTTDETKSGLIADLANITTSLEGYYYIVVATSTKTDIQVDIDEIATDLNGKADVDLTNTAPAISFATAMNSAGIRTIVYNTTSNGCEIRVWSDGLKEILCKQISNASAAAVDISYPTNGTSYAFTEEPTLIVNQYAAATATTGQAYRTTGYARSSAGFSVYFAAANASISYYACGY